MGDVEKLTKDTIADGGVLAMLYFDVHAKSEDLVKELATGFVNGLIQKQGVVYALGEIDKPAGGEKGKNWSSSIAVKILTRDFAVLAGICMAHSPYTVEVLRPDEVKLSLAEVHELLSIMSATTAEYKRYILTKLSKPEELLQLQENLRKRVQMGKKLLKEGEK